MMTRYTRKDAEAAFHLLAKAYDLKTGPAYIDGVCQVGTHILQKAPMHNQYRIIRMGEHGSEWTPFGHSYYTPREFVQMVRFALDLKHYDGKVG
jgi:hypothetical protein